MDVTCDRCSTRYEFDEALVSSRGTTVKCTNCGNQFKVYRPAGAAALDGWLVRTTDGRELSFQAMRHLQAAIASGAVSKQDVLIPSDGGEPRRLGKIEELKSFFAAALSDAPPDRSSGSVSETAPGHRTSSFPPGRPGVPMEVTAIGTGSAQGSQPGRTRDGERLAPRTGDTLRPPSRASDPVTVPRQAAIPQGPVSVSEAPTVATRRRPDGGGARLAPPAKPSRFGSEEAVERLHAAVNDAIDTPSTRGRGSSRGRDGVDRSLRARDDLPGVSDDDTIGDADLPVTRRQELESEYPLDDPEGAGRDGMSLPPATPSPSAARPSILRRSDVYSDPRFSNYGRGRPGLARWVVGVVAVGVLAVGGFALFKRYMPPSDKPQTAKEDNRVDTLLEEGDKRLDEGDVEGAKDQFIKASGITETDPRVSRALARIEVVRADMLWLHDRVLEDESPLHASVQQQLAKAVARAAVASDKATAQGADDPLTVALRIDVLRLQGKGAEARRLVDKLEGAGPEGLRALALLDLNEADPNYGSVIDRLRSAARAERKLRRSQAMLVYALARAGKVEDAAKELETLKASGSAEAWLPPLEAFVGRSPAAEPASSASAATSSSAPSRVEVEPPPPPSDHVEPFATAEPHHVEPFATAEPHTPAPPATEPPATEPPPPPPPPPPPADTSDLPPTVDTSDLPM